MVVEGAAGQAHPLRCLIVLKEPLDLEGERRETWLSSKRETEGLLALLGKKKELVVSISGGH